MASIYEIAKAAGLSPSTVARALRGTGYCGPENKKKILALAEEMNYIPSYTARSLKSKRTNKILFCIPDIANPFYFGMIQGVSCVLEEFNYLPLLCPTRGDIENELRMLRNLQGGDGDGMVFVSFDFSPQNIAAVNACSRPIVLTNNYQSAGGHDHFDCVYVDTKMGIHMACEHLIAQGMTRIGYIGGDVQKQTGRERFEGYLSAMQEAQLPINQHFLHEGDFTMASGAKAMNELLALPQRPEALVVANDLMAVGAYKACQEYGLSMPGEIAIIGMDDSDLARCVGLSSVKMQEEQIGRAAAQLLMDRIINGAGEKKVIRLQPELALRASSKKN